MHTETRRYHVIEAVGRGGFGTVYRAEYLGAGGFRKSVALKVLNAEVAEQQDFAERLRDEGRMLGLLRHRAVVRVDGLLLLNNRWTVVMEFVEGVDVKTAMHAGPIPVAVVLEVIQEIASALGGAYESVGPDGRPLRLLHRDIKPSNIQLTAEGEVKILDFGVARADFQQRESVTRSIFFGSLGYMAPERFDGIDTHAGDIYSLGVVMVEMLTGHTVGRTSGNRQRHRERVQPALQKLRAAVADQELVALAADCLAYDPSQRPTARELERRVRTLRLRHAEPWLKDWAAGVVGPLLANRPHLEDDLSGSVLIEQADISGTFPPDPETAEVAQRSVWWIRSVAAAAGAGVVLLLGSGLIVLGLTMDDSPLRRADGVARAPQAQEAPVPQAEPLASVEPTAKPTAEPTAEPENESTAKPAEEPTARSASEPTAEPATKPTARSASEPTARSASEPTARSASEPTAKPAARSASEPTAKPTSEPTAKPRSEPAAKPTDQVTAEPTAKPTAKPAAETTTSPEPATVSSGGGKPGLVMVTGDASGVRLVRDSHSYRVGSVPAGTYEIMASFGDAPEAFAGTVSVREGRRVTLVCRAGLKRCTAR